MSPETAGAAGLQGPRRRMPDAAGVRVAPLAGMLSHRPIKRGVEAGLVASVPQVLLAKAESGC